MACIIVLGCYRSGTSAVAGALHHLGVMMGKEFDTPAFANPKGFFEDLEFKRLFDMMAEGKNVDGLLDVLVRIRERENPLWGVKDPQLCLFLHRLTPFLKEHKLINVSRPKEAVCHSLAKATIGTSSEQFTSLVDHYLSNKELQLSSFAGPKLELSFEDLLNSPTDKIGEIAEFVSLPVAQAAIDFVSKIS